MDERADLQKELDVRLRVAFREEEASRHDLTDAAIAFDRYVRTCLRHAGWAHSTAAVAKMLGEDVANYNRAKRGENISRNRLLVWLGKWLLITSSGGESRIPSSMRTPRVTEGESIFQIPTLPTLEASTHAPEAADEPPGSRIDVFIRGEDGTVYEGFAYRKTFAGA